MIAPPAAARRGAAAATPALLLLLAAATATTANAFLVAPPPRPLSAAGAAAAATAGRRPAHLWAAPTLILKQQPSSSRRRRPLWAVGEEDYEGEPPSTELGKLLEEDPKAKPVLAYLGFVSLALLGLGIATFKLGGQLLGLGFADDRCDACLCFIT